MKTNDKKNSEEYVITTLEKCKIIKSEIQIIKQRLKAMSEKLDSDLKKSATRSAITTTKQNKKELTP